MTESSEFEGIIDVHAHADPDTTRRSLDILEMCKLYRDRGFRGVLLMNHWDPTGGQAYLARKVVPGIEVWGGIVCNRLVGGINPAAVEHAAQIEGQHTKMVYMPTLDCENEVRWSGSGRPFVRVAEKGRLLPQVHEMLDLIAGLGLAVSTGHNSPEEMALIARAAKEHGVERVLATNPTYPAVDMTIDQMVETARLGAYIELIYYVIGMPEAKWTLEGYAEVVKTVGAEHCILSSCGGQAWMPVHTFAWRELLAGMRENGVTQAEIETMTKTNPAFLLGLD